MPLAGLPLRSWRAWHRAKPPAIVAATLSALALLAACTTSPVLSDAMPVAAVAKAHAMPVQGVDVSRWQGDIDWEKVKKAGVTFAFIKATEGGDHLDPMFRKNWDGAAAAGVARGAYHFVYWCRPMFAQALWFVLNVPLDPTALPPVLDLEWNTTAACPTRPAAAEAREAIREMLAVMEGFTGRRPIIYVDIHFYRDVMAGHSFDYPFWVRNTAGEPETLYGARTWVFWQYTATGQVPGIQGNVDRNAFGGTLADWTAWLSLGAKD